MSGPARGDSEQDAAAAVRPVGRPRSAQAHQAILQAALELLAEKGLEGWSMEEVRARAGVGKATIYRRWPSKVELVKEAVSSLNWELPSVDTGSARGDYVTTAGAALASEALRAGRILPRLMIEAGEDPELRSIFHAKLVEPRRELVRDIVRRGIERGELRKDLDVELAVDLLTGPVMYRVLMSGADFEGALGHPEKVWDALAEGIAPRPEPSLRRPARASSPRSPRR